MSKAFSVYTLLIKKDGCWQAEWIWMDIVFFWVNFSLYCLLCHHSSRKWKEKEKDLHTYSHKKIQLWGAHLKRQQDWTVKSKQQQWKMVAAVSQPPLSSQAWCKMSPYMNHNRFHVVLKMMSVTTSILKWCFVPLLLHLS